MVALLSERQDFFFDLQRVKLNVSLRDSAIAHTIITRTIITYTIFTHTIIHIVI